MQIDRELVRRSFDQKPLVEVNGKKFIINPLTEQIPATPAALLREASRWLIEEGDFDRADKIAGEEDKGAVLVAATALMTDLPFAMARWYPFGLAGQIAVDFQMEYTAGRLYLNGVSAGDKVIIVDDMISTGGTTLALIEAIQKAKAEIVDIIYVAEKVDYGGAARVLRGTGYRVKSLVKFTVAGDVSRVID